ncbi:MAG TPA: penicillin-binding protein 2 [Ottowia sp.]|uniref:penicillin-binding protein 2 n=1 Tax=Ottowia sp. TaxID=1898956 RepID=UPI001DE8384A|nr:penicillin-binding protein 2 [Ottowia sp.]MBS0401229.1 penicillin-binding protein 2 [Pseudomonadota bacterium]MBS0414810.1 penicillin-binding protein 2 [Pseudomonadota bacterium]HMN57032.1 penicillin-binding protein 2 [Ottowia sp.]
MTELRNLEAELTRFRLRLLVVALVMLGAFGLLGWRLYVLQVLRHDDLARQAETNRTAAVPIVPNRGEIFDRNGIVLASNYRSYTLEITPSRLGRPVDEAIDAIGQVVEISPRDRRRFKRLREDSRNFESLPIRMHLSDEEVARFAAQRWRFPGVEIKARLFRDYPLGETGAHLIGYIGRINQKEKDRIEDSDDAANYRGTDYIGKLGVEASYEKLLHGTTGVQRMETSAGGYAVRRLATQPAVPGESIKLTIDIRLQKMVEELYGRRRGALVAIDPRNGEVLALVSKPTFDPNLFVDGIDQENWDELNGSLDKPLLNRALRGTYPPGSTYKPFMGLGALETGKRVPSTVVMDGGSWTFGGHTFRSGHALGPVDLHRAIAKSSNVYFYQLANDMGVNGIHDFMKPLGFGQITGIDLPGEVRGVLPSTAWKRATYRRPQQQKWYAGETISLGIGQGYNNFTMLQLANATATLAGGGVHHTPHLLMAEQDPHSGQFHANAEPAGQSMGYKPEHVATILRAMVAVTQEGTSRGVFAGAPYLSGGKTGTAQAISVGQNAHYNAAKLAEYQRDHSLYIAFAPAEHPTIAVAAIVENAGFGAAAAAPIVRRVMDYWVAGLVPSEEDMKAVERGQAGPPIGTPRRVTDLAAP